MSPDIPDVGGFLLPGDAHVYPPNTNSRSFLTKGAPLRCQLSLGFRGWPSAIGDVNVYQYL